MPLTCPGTRDEGEDVGTGVGVLPFRLLRRHIGWSADDCSRLGRAECVLSTIRLTVHGDLLRQSEIKQLGNTPGQYENVRRF